MQSTCDSCLGTRLVREEQGYFIVCMHEQAPLQKYPWYQGTLTFVFHLLSVLGGEWMCMPRESGSGHRCYLHEYESGSSKGWRPLFWHLEIPNSRESFQPFPKLSCSYRAIPLLLMLRICYCLQTHFRKYCFSAPRRTSKAMVSDTVPRCRKSAFTFGLERGRPRVWATSLVIKLESYWLLQNRTFFSHLLTVVVGMWNYLCVKFLRVHKQYCFLIMGNKPGCWNLKMYHRIELNNYFLTSIS